MSDWRATLENEFSAGDGSFLMTMRSEWTWDESAFDRVLAAMEQCCRECDGESEMIERWIAAGFFDFLTLVPGTMAHENFKKPRSPRYYEVRLLRVEELADWFYRGGSPFIGDQVPALPQE